MLKISLDSNAAPTAPQPSDFAVADDLPMPHEKKAKKPSASEKADYARRQQQHYSKYPDYEKRFCRPPKNLFDWAWAILDGFVPKMVAIKKKKVVQLFLSPQERIALTVLVDYFLQEEGKGRRATFNDLFDEVCRKFSDHFVCSPARRSRDMRPATVRSARRDLLCNEININKLYAIYLSLAAPNAEQLLKLAFADADKQQAFLLPSDTRKRFLECTGEQREYFSSSNRPVRLWFDRGKEGAALDAENLVSEEYCAETAYNCVFIEAKSQKLLKTQSNTRLYFNMDAFNEDYKIAENLKEKLHKRFVENFKFDPEMPRWKRRAWKRKAIKTSGKKKMNAAPNQKHQWTKAEVWSEREEFFYYASVMRGLSSDLKSDKIVTQFARRKTKIEQEQRNADQRRYEGFVIWLVRTARSPAMVLDEVSEEHWKQQALDLLKTHFASILQQYEQKRQEAFAAVQAAKQTAAVTAERANDPMDEALSADDGSANGGRTRAEERLKDLEEGVAFLKTLEVASAGGDALAIDDVIKASIADRQWRRDVRRELAKYDEVQSFLWQHRAVRAQVKHRSGEALIRSRFTRSINRRYQPRHMWPTYVGEWRLSGPDDKNANDENAENSLRKRWFKGCEPRAGASCDLVGYDISSSQTQIIATLLGSAALEEAAMDGQTSFKKKLARWAFEKHLDPDDKFELKEDDDAPAYADANDKRLLELCKSLWMRISYGSTVKEVVSEQDSDPVTYGPGWTRKNAQLFLDFLNEKFPEMERFLASSVDIGKRIAKENPREGVIFIDPYDDSEVRWNPLKRTDCHLKSDDRTLILSLPASKADVKEKFDIGPDVRYEVDGNALKKMIAPCLIHMLDAFYSSLVMEKLADRGVRDFVGIHDCWLVPRTVMADGQVQDGLRVLKTAMQEAAGDWYRGLAPVYQRLAHYLDGHPEYDQWLKAAQERWKQRIQAGYVPQFVAKED